LVSPSVNKGVFGEKIALVIMLKIYNIFIISGLRGRLFFAFFTPMFDLVDSEQILSDVLSDLFNNLTFVSF